MVGAYKPATLKEALEMMSCKDYTVMAGGTDLMVKRKRWAGLEPSFDKPVLFIADLPELTNIHASKDFITIGAACTLSQLIDSSLIPDFYKSVFQEMASPSIRNSATLAGNICNSSPAGDSLPLLYALDASLVIETCCRRREVPIEEFITGPGKNLLCADELVTGITIPIAHFDQCVYRKIGTRKADALSKLSFIGLIRQGEPLDVRIAIGAAAPTVIRCRDVEQEIASMYAKGSMDMKEIMKYYEPQLRPIDDQRSTAEYRKNTAMRLLEDFLQKNLCKGCEVQ